MKVVLDTNVIVSGLLSPHSPPGEIIRAWRRYQVDLVLAEEQLTEIERVLHYPKIQRILGWNTERITAFVQRLGRRALRIRVSGIPVEVPGDASDIPILASLVGSSAQFLVTGDSDLLALRDSYPILTPGEFLRVLKSKHLPK